MNRLFDADARLLLEAAALLATIRDEPDADLPRLVLADWLEDRGDDGFAELIRYQCDRAFGSMPDLFWEDIDLGPNGPFTGGDPRLYRHPGIAADHACAPYRRGLPGGVWLRGGAAVSAAGPAFRDFPATALKLDRVPGAVEFAGLPWLGRVSELDLSGCGVTPGDLASLARDRGLVAVRTWHLAGNRVGVAGVRALAERYAETPWGCDLGLDLSRCGLGAAAAEQAARLATSGLRWLRLGGNGAAFGRRLVAELGREGGGRWWGVPWLDLSGCGVRDTEAEALARWPGVGYLTGLSLADNRLTDAGVRALAASPLLDRLISLDLSGNRHLTDKAAFALAASQAGAWKCLFEVRFEGTGVGDPGYEALAWRRASGPRPAAADLPGAALAVPPVRSRGLSRRRPRLGPAR